MEICYLIVLNLLFESFGLLAFGIGGRREARCCLYAGFIVKIDQEGAKIRKCRVMNLRAIHPRLLSTFFGVLKATFESLVTT